MAYWSRVLTALKIADMTPFGLFVVLSLKKPLIWSVSPSQSV